MKVEDLFPFEHTPECTCTTIGEKVVTLYPFGELSYIYKGVIVHGKWTVDEYHDVYIIPDKYYFRDAEYILYIGGCDDE